MVNSTFLIVVNRSLLRTGKVSFGYLACLFILISANAHGARVEFIDYGKNGESDLLFLSNGRVLHGKFSGHKTRFKTPAHLEPDFLSTYRPSILPGLEEVQRVYERMRTDYSENAQCFNMAHVWAYEEFKRSGLQSMKMFLFFTRKYIRRHRFHWWFHVAPMVFVEENGAPTPIILDRRYTLNPFDLKTWTDHFIIGGKPCKQVNKFYDYYHHQEEEECYLIARSMYYWQPRSIRLGDNAPEKTSFSKAELKAAKAGF